MDADRQSNEYGSAGLKVESVANAIRRPEDQQSNFCTERDLNSEFEQFAVDPRRTPKRVLAAHCSNEIASFLWNLGTSRSPTPYFLSPIPPESLTMPVDDCFRPDDD